MSGAPIAGDVPLDLRGVAEHTGLAYTTVRTYRTKGLLPEPDGPPIGRSAWWWRSRIDEWDAGRKWTPPTATHTSEEQ